MTAAPTPTHFFDQRIYQLGSPDLRAKLGRLVGQQMGDICPNGFSDPASAHCAHFVSHLLGFDFGCTCAELTGEHARPGNVRVHEIYARCSEVGPWAERAGNRDCLVFVSRESAFDRTTKTLINIPNKHIGICCGTTVFHYSSRHDAVLRKTVPEFFAYFEKLYGGKQALHFGQ